MLANASHFAIIYLMRTKFKLIASVVASVFLLGIAVYLILPIFADSIYPEIPDEELGAINKCADIFGLDKALFSALLAKESGFNPRAVSRAGAMGVGQIMPGTWRGLLNVPELEGLNLSTDPFDANSNICRAAAHLGGLMSTYGGDQMAALIAYNGGDGAARRYLTTRSTSGLVAETRAYAPAILGAKDYYAEAYKDKFTPYAQISSGGSWFPTASSLKLEVPKPSDIRNAFWKSFINDYIKNLVK